LQTHCRRKFHQLPAGLSKPIRRLPKPTAKPGSPILAAPLSFINLSGNLLAAKLLPSAAPLTKESILQNSISAENFSDKFSPSKFGQISAQKQRI
jgi:hypothetical protein